MGGKIKMHIQQSYTENNYGVLYVVPTPIGNLEDITFRALKTLEEVDVIAAEDTRHTQKLLTHFQIKNQLISYHEHNREERIPELISRLEQGDNIGLVSDAGMPAISDPGHELVKAAIALDIAVVVLPGANAALSALVGSGLPTGKFLFYGFLPRKKREKEAELSNVKNEPATLIFYESPYRIAATLQAILEQLGDREIVIARELTKLYEEYIRGTTTEVLTWVKEHPLKGECCIVVAGADDQTTSSGSDWWASLTVSEHVAHYEETKQVPHKDAMRLVAQERGISRREVYQQIHVKDKNE